MAEKLIRLSVAEEAWRRLNGAAIAQGRSRNRIATECFMRLGPYSPLPAPQRSAPKSMGRILPDNVVFFVRELALSGRTYRSLASQFGVSLATIQRAINQNNGYRQARRKGPSVQPPEVVESIRHDRELGRSYTQLSNKYSLSKRTCHNIVNRKGGYAFR